jgi:uncharacterized protein
VIEVVVAGLGLVPPAPEVLLLLREREGGRVLPIGIGPLEAQAIALPLEGVRPPRPLTHDVFAEVLGRLGARPRHVEITFLADGAFHARLVLESRHDTSAQGSTDADGAMDIDIRPSDAVALALRAGAPIYVAEAVMEDAGIPAEALTQESGETVADIGSVEEPADSKLSPFRDFIETLDLGDLDGGDRPPTPPEPGS